MEPIQTNPTEQDEPVFQLQDLLGDLTPNRITPHLAALQETKSEKRPKQLAELLLTSLLSDLSGTPRELLHKGEIQVIRQVDPQPLCYGSYAILSLLLLHLSFGEQCVLIEALYPSHLQLTAKSVALLLTKETSPTVTVREDEKVTEKLDQLLAGMAMLLHRNNTELPTHADQIQKEQAEMAKLVAAMQERDAYRKAKKRQQAAEKKKDELQR